MKSLLPLFLVFAAQLCAEQVAYEDATLQQLDRFNRGDDEELFILLERDDFVALESVAHERLALFAPAQTKVGVIALEPLALRKIGYHIEVSRDDEEWHILGEFIGQEEGVAFSLFTH